MKWGPIVVVSAFLDPGFTWPRWVGILSDDAIFPGLIDATFDQTLGPDDPVIYNCFVPVPPDEIDVIGDLAAKTDGEIADLGRVLASHDVDTFVRDTMVTRYIQGELELSPEYYLNVLAQLEQPVGNIHLCGDYTHRVSFLAGAALSAFRAVLSGPPRHLGAPRDQPRRLPRDGRRQGGRHELRRGHVARGRRRTGDGEELRRRL